MSYFLKQSKLKYGTYLQIYEGIYDKTDGKVKNHCVQKLGYLHNLTTDEMPDPVSFYKDQIAELNRKANEKKDNHRTKLIDDSPVKNIGYCLIKTMFNTLGLAKDIEPMKHIKKFQFPISQLVEALIYSRSVEPCSKLKTKQEVIPVLYEKYNFSLDQIYDGLKFIGENYQQFIEIMNHRISKLYKRVTDKVYFDCTNYYFEIDFEKEDKMKGPSKENRNSPIIGQALLLDSECIPLGMEMYPGNESEKPKIREVIKHIKETHNIIGKTVRVADKGLNCGDNIYDAADMGDGYIFSQSVLKTNEVERLWVLLPNDYKEVKDKSGNLVYMIKSCVDKFEIEIKTEDGKKEKAKIKQKRVATFNPSLRDKKLYEIDRMVNKAMKHTYASAKKSEYGECGKYVEFITEDGKKEKIQLNQSKIDLDKSVAGYNLLVTSEIEMSDSEVYSVYHNLWEIENSFRQLKTELNARPVYLQNKHEIYGHFLICYYALTLMKLLEKKALKKKFNFNEILEVVRNLNVVSNENEYINIAGKSNNITALAEKFKLPLNHYYFLSEELDKLFTYKYASEKE